MNGKKPRTSLEEKNMRIVTSAKKTLIELGYDVCQSHLYHVFSRLCGYKNWNVAKVKRADFESVLKKFSENELLQQQHFFLSQEHED